MTATLHIGVDGMNLAIPRGTGVATYARSLAESLVGLGHRVDLLYGLDIASGSRADEREIALFEQLMAEKGYRRPKYPSLPWALAMLRAWRGETAIDVPLSSRVEARPVAARPPSHRRVVNAQNLFERANHFFRSFGRFMPVRVDDPPAIMHWTYPIPVAMEGTRNVYTVHDLVPLKMPYATLDHKPTHIRLLRECVRRGDHIVTVSERSRDDLFGFYPEADPDRVTNTYQTILPPPVPLAPEMAQHLLGGEFDLQPGRYFLFFGSIEPKKNVGRLLQAFLAADVDIPMVVVTARGWQAQAEAALLERRPRIRHVEYVPPNVLDALIRGARAVTFPSLFEGFGLPVIEAMRVGTPVLTSREGSLAEVAGDAALFVDPYDIGDIAAGLTRLARDDALCADLRARGPARADLYSMTRYQDRLAALYARVLSQTPRSTLAPRR